VGTGYETPASHFGSLEKQLLGGSVCELAEIHSGTSGADSDYGCTSSVSSSSIDDVAKEESSYPVPRGALLN
jgi:hypothetical protein